MIYLDHNATSPLRASVREAMLDCFDRDFGNPSSIHQAGRLARNALDAARVQVAKLVNVHAAQVVFTGGGTEANNLAIRGIAMRALANGRKGRILVGATEHSAILEPADDLQAFGIRTERLPVDAQGSFDPDALAERLDDDVLLVSLHYANNETGCLQDVPALARVVRAHGIPFHTDAVQMAGKLPLDFPASGAHLMTLSAHKLGGPKGVGALITDKSLDLLPQVSGGGQESGWRAGTENLPGIVGFGVAAEDAGAELEQYAGRTRKLRDELESRLQQLPGTTVFAQRAGRLPNTLQFSLAGMDGETVQMGLDRQGIAVSTGSACHSRSMQASHVLLAMGVDDAVARGAIRVSFGIGNQAADVDAVMSALEGLARVLPGAAVQGGGPTAW